MVAWSVDEIEDKMEKRIPENFTWQLALFDFLPVLFFGVSTIVLGYQLESYLFFGGAVVCLIAGSLKVLWKLIVVFGKKNISILSKQMRIAMPTGFLMIIVGTILKGRKNDLHAFYMFVSNSPARFFLLFTVALMLLMFVFAAKMDSNDAKANWIEEITNTLAQFSFMIGVLALFYIGDYYHALPEAMAVASEGIQNGVRVEKGDNYIAFIPEDTEAVDTQVADMSGDIEAVDAQVADMSGDTEAVDTQVADMSGDTEAVDTQVTDMSGDTGLIFYPGAKVECESYAPLMQKCAEQGIMCVLVRMPDNLAIMDIRAAGEIREKYPEIERWFLGGHSLGGAMASFYISEHAKEYDGLVLMGAYSTKNLSDTDLKVLSIYGSEDMVLNKEKYEETRSNLPADMTEIVIDGGCHALFGNYGSQNGDGIPRITAAEQQDITVSAIINCLL